ncbi:flagellar basal body-associated protein FliL [Cytobacillus sp. IB215316]|uniref:flagellar basal body-associated protein FliL n=1 Tax=Cytobacillus sp. IB215316 TaxID=3097354 RepID=UPI002A13FAF6|nr:flagellar basal body-associated protein FliL [Cytobacillus sp. IB215316]MDX8362245.1 flagellar basal body-associated protein FliL [Cytobacillus sp. IB215316]
MNKNRLYTLMIIMLATFTIVGLILLFVLLDIGDKDVEAAPTIDEIIDNSMDMDDITTNLLDEGFIRVSFKIETDSKGSKKELQKRDFQVRNIIIQEISEMKAEQFSGKEGKIYLEEKLMNKINELMQDGNVNRVYITSFLLQ